jgi:hypothetical protein
LFRRAQAYFEIKQYDLVVQDTNAVLLIEPTSIPSRALLGRALKILNNFQKAEEQLSHVILQDDTQPALFIGFFLNFYLFIYLY